MALDIHSPMDLVYECFVKLGLRYVCVLQDGKYAGMVSFRVVFRLPTLAAKVNIVLQTHKKGFVKYMRQVEEKQGHV